MATNYEVFREFKDGKTQIEFQNLTKAAAAEISYGLNQGRPWSTDTDYFYSFREQTHDVPINMHIKQ